jgi:ribosomal protein L16/L10AE
MNKRDYALIERDLTEARDLVLELHFLPHLSIRENQEIKRVQKGQERSGRNQPRSALLS